MKLSENITPTGTSTTDVVQWTQDLFDLHARIAPRFARPEPRRRVLAYLKGVMSDTPRKNGWQLAEHAREATPYGMQRLLSAAAWDDGLVRDDLLHYVYKHLGTKDGIFVLDETSFPKRGKKSAGVQVHYCGTTGHLENCQVAVFLAYVTALGHTLIDSRLYLPKSWIEDPERCREAGIPENVGFQTKCELARVMVERILKAEIPISWVVADTVYGNNLDLRTWLEDQGIFFVLAVECREPVGIRTPDGARRQVEVREVEALLLEDQDWQRLSMGDGTKGPRLYDWAAVPILHRWEDDGQHWLLIRRCIDDPNVKTYYFVFAAPGTTLLQMVQAIGARWRIEDDFKTSKALGLDQYEVRQWICWYRHVTLVLLAHAYLSVICAEAKKATLATPTVWGENASPPVSVSHPPLMLPAPKASLSLPTLEMASLPKETALLQGSLAAPVLALTTSVPKTLPPSPPLSPAPLTLPEIRHLLARLIWPQACSCPLVLSWSGWRRHHRGMASYYHTKRRLDAA